MPYPRFALLCAILVATAPARAATISGQIRGARGGQPVSQVSLAAIGSNVVGSSGADGGYQLGNVAGDLTVVPSKANDPAPWLSSIDAVVALRAAVGLQQLTPAERLACDVNGSGSMSSIDAVLILQRVVGLPVQFPAAQSCGSDWGFLPAALGNSTAIQPQPGPTSCQPGGLQFSALNTSVSGQDFLGVVYGDCDGSWQPPAATPTPTPIPTSIPTPTPSSAVAAPVLGGCSMFPADNAWNRDISADPVDVNSNTYVAAVNEQGRLFLHADFGSPPEYGIPYVVVPSTQPAVPITFVDYGDESDPGPYPVPPNAPVEAGGDRHVLVLQSGSCTLFELFGATKNAVGSGWSASSGAKFNLNSNALRPETWTSADAAGLPVLPGLVRYDEVAAGEIRHALRFTVWRSNQGYVHPATHWAGNVATKYPPMGARFRLKASYNISAYTGQARVVLQALKKYGMFVADNGTSWYISGSRDARWNDDELDQLKLVPSSAFEVVQLGTVHRP